MMPGGVVLNNEKGQWHSLKMPGVGDGVAGGERRPL